MDRTWSSFASPEWVGDAANPPGLGSPRTRRAHVSPCVSAAPGGEGVFISQPNSSACVAGG